MVFLNRIYTRGGDDGETSLGTGRRVPKTHPRIVAYGGVDELNAVLGLARQNSLPEPVAEWIGRVQNDLFDLGADLCVPAEASTEAGSAPTALRVTASQTQRLERWIDQINERLEPLTSFVLPGGTAASSWLHLARTVCRRVEIGCWALHEIEPVNSEVLCYLNRLSDLLFVLGQFCNHEGRSSVLWVPGQNRQPDSE